VKVRREAKKVQKAVRELRRRNPKPRATQMICRLHKTECPKLKPGWDLTVVSPAEAYGWIGMTLEPGRYLKCKLEDELKPIFDLMKKL
jgi:hypothetical protein